MLKLCSSSLQGFLLSVFIIKKDFFSLVFSTTAGYTDYGRSLLSMYSVHMTVLMLAGEAAVVN